MDVYHFVQPTFRCLDYCGACGRISFCIGDGITVMLMDIYIILYSLPLGVNIAVVHMHHFV